MSRIFISYKRVDKDKVFKIKDQIEKALGEKCWIDLDGIESDAQFVSVIIDAIDNSEIVLFMHSINHTFITDFESDWTVRELNYAKEEGKRIVFVNIDRTKLTKWFKFMFPQKQQVDGTSTENVDKLCLDLKSWLSNRVVEFGRNSVKTTSHLAQEDTQESKNTLIPIIQNRKFGFINKVTKQVQIACEYDNVGGFNDGLCWVIKDEKMGFINNNGAIVIPVMYDYYVQDFHNGYATVKKDGKWGVIDKNGEILLPFIYDDVRRYDGEIAVVKNNKKWGIIKNDMSVLVALDYDDMMFYDGVAIIEKDYMYGVINKEGKETIPCIYDYIGGLYYDNHRVAVARRYKKSGLVDIINNKIIVPFDYDDLGYLSQGIISAKRNNRWGYIDTKGNLLIDFVFDEAEEFSKGFAVVGRSNKYGMIDKKGNIVIPIIYDKIYRSDDCRCNLLAVARNGKAGYINFEGNIIIPFVYDDAQEFNDGYAAVCRNKKWGFINTQGKLIIPFKYDDAPNLFENGRVYVELNGKEGFVDSFGNDTFL